MTMDVIIGPALGLIFQLLKLYTWVIIIGVIMSWLIHFNVINLSNQFVRMVYDVVTRLTEPLLSKIRGFLPDLGGVDISPCYPYSAFIFCPECRCQSCAETWLTQAHRSPLFQTALRFGFA